MADGGWRIVGCRQDMSAPDPGEITTLRELPESSRRALFFTSAVITQNVDNLHQVSGVPEDKVIELHGNATYARCLGCSLRIELVEIEREFQASGAVAPCKACGGILKSATISFGQPMPLLPMQRAQDETMACDLFIVLGSSLSVFPAADFPLRAKQNGAALAIVNRDPTEMDELADIVIHAGIGATLGE